MLFNSFAFAFAFFPIVYTAYLLAKRDYRIQNVLLLIASYVFYAHWSRRFVLLLAFTTLVDFTSAQLIQRMASERWRRACLVGAVTSNLAVLSIFKYFNFFSSSASDLLSAVGLHPDFVTLNVVLPVGISFYTFQSISYTVDVYRRRLKPTTNLLEYALYVSFFPHLVAGPIQRWPLLEQIARPRTIRSSQISAALFLLAWGYFKKVVVADNCAVIADAVFGRYTNYGGLDVVLGVAAFSLQIYADFSGYSDIARGLAKLMGFELMVNFRLPYFSTSPSEFWTRWHISLSSWLRDYLYIPLGGNRKGELNTYRNLLITMLLGGLWHGAAWTFVAWGAFHGLVLVAWRRCQQWRPPRLAFLAERKSVQLAAMLILVAFGWIIFRSRSLSQVVFMASHAGFSISPQTLPWAYDLLLWSVPVLLIEVRQYRSGDLLVWTKGSTLSQVALYALLVLGILLFGVRTAAEFIYFQF